MNWQEKGNLIDNETGVRSKKTTGYSKIIKWNSTKPKGGECTCAKQQPDANETK